MKRHNVRRLLALVLVAALCLLCGAAAQPNATEIHIYSADDLVQLSKSCKLDTYSQGKTVYLDNDVDLSGSDFVPIPTFGGTFEGQGHTVSGLELSGDASHMGLFRYVQAVGTVRDLKVTGNIDAAGTLNEIGAIVGTNYGTISGCSFNGTISGENNVGGIAGTNEGSGMIYNCKTEGFVEGDHYVGGIVGQNIGTISYCSNTTGVNINASEAVGSAEDLDTLTLPAASDDEDDDAPKKANTSTDVGGICGFSSGVIIGCTNWGGVGFEHVGYNIGGIVGRQSGLVSGCTNWGTASGRKDVGGICGQMEPFITLDVESGSIGAMAKELNTLHDLMDTLLNHSGAAASSLAATVGVLSDSAARATESARYVAERTTDYVDNTVSTVNEVFIRINTAEKMLAPAITEFSAAAVSLDKSIDYFNKGFDYLDIVDEMTEADKTAFKDAAKDLSVSSDQHGGACVRERHHRLDDVQIDAGRLKPGRLLGVDVDQILERRLAERGEKQARRRKIARDPRLAVRCLARERGKAAVIVCRLVENAALFELLPVGAEGRRVEHLTAGGDIAALDADNDVRVRERPLLGAHIAGVAVLLQFGAGRTVQDEGKTDLHIVTSVKGYGCGNDRLSVKAAAKSARPDSSE